MRLAKTVLLMTLVAGSALAVIPYLILLFSPPFLRFELGISRWWGALPLAAGVLLAVSAVYQLFLYGEGTPAPFDPPKKLVVTGPYERLRNPMYLGALLILLGESVVLQSFAIWVYTLLALLGLHLFVVLYEEPALKKKFGGRYVEYMKKVPRWFPRSHYKWMPI